MPVGCHSRLKLYWGKSSCRIWPVTKRICACSVLPGHRKMCNVLPAIPYLDSDPAQLSGCTKFEGASARVTQSLKKRSVHKILYLFALLGLFVCLFFPNGWTYLPQFFILPWPHIISILPLPSPSPPLSLPTTHSPVLTPPSCRIPFLWQTFSGRWQKNDIFRIRSQDYKSRKAWSLFKNFKLPTLAH